MSRTDTEALLVSHPRSTIVEDVDESDNPRKWIEIKGYRYTFAAHGWYVYRLNAGEWKPQAFRITQGGNSVFMPRDIWEDRDKSAAIVKEIIDRLGVDEFADTQVLLQNALEADTGSIDDLRSARADLSTLTQLNWLPEWPDAFVRKSIEKTLAFLAERAAKQETAATSSA